MKGSPRIAIFSITDKFGNPRLLQVKSTDARIVEANEKVFLIDVLDQPFMVRFELPEEGSITHSFEINQDSDIVSISFDSTAVLWLIDVVDRSNYKGPVWWMVNK